ncbi:MAG: hypothetical protein HYR67_14910 [Bacteroidetes bacterium]|nr:hypothetical protein [Bacteroidota bacterium]
MVIEKVIQELVAELGGVKESLRIYSGEANSAIFSNIRFLEALKQCKRRGVKRMQVVVGPVLSCYSINGKRISPIADLAKQGAIELYFRPRRGTVKHFCIFDDQNAKVQPSHKPAEEVHLRKSFQRVSKDDAPFTTLLADFNHYARKENKSRHPEQEFLLLTPTEIREVAARVGSKYDNLTKNQIQKLVRQIYRDNKFQAGQLWKAKKEELKKAPILV